LTRKLVFFLVVSVFAFTNTSCAAAGPFQAKEENKSQLASPKAEQGSKPVELSANLKFDDIPVPINFNLDLKDSFVFKNGIVRVGVVKYVGKAGISEITEFYKKNMPSFNWSLVSSIEYYKSIMVFLKDTQSCVVILEQDGGRLNCTIASGPKN